MSMGPDVDPIGIEAERLAAVLGTRPAPES